MADRSECWGRCGSLHLLDILLVGSKGVLGRLLDRREELILLSLGRLASGLGGRFEQVDGGPFGLGDPWVLEEVLGHLLREDDRLLLVLRIGDAGALIMGMLQDCFEPTGVERLEIGGK